MQPSISHRPHRELARFGNIAVTECGIVGEVLIGNTLTLYDIQCALRYAQACFHHRILDCFEEREPIAIA